MILQKDVSESIILCPYCKNSGIKCELCNGMGKLKKTVTVEIRQMFEGDVIQNDRIAETSG